MSAAESRFEALRAITTPLVGREEEIDLLMRRWEQAKRSDGQVVLITGEPGIGKSRIAQTIGQRISGETHTRLRYFCSPHHQDSALYPSIAQLERAAGFRREDTHERRLAKLEAVLAQGTKLVSVAASYAVSLCSASGVFALELATKAPQLEQTSQSSSSLQSSPSLGQQSFVFGDWGGLRSWLSDQGIDLGLGYLSENAWDVAGGKSLGGTCAGQENLSLDLNWEKIASLNGLSTHVAFVSRQGRNVSSQYVGDVLFQAQEIYGSAAVERVYIHLAFERKSHKILPTGWADSMPACEAALEESELAADLRNRPRHDCEQTSKLRRHWVARSPSIRTRKRNGRRHWSWGLLCRAVRFWIIFAGPGAQRRIDKGDKLPDSPHVDPF